MHALSGAYDNCSCPDGYTLIPGSGGAAPTCSAADPSWAPAVPKCASSGPPPADADAGVSGKVMLAMGIGAIALVVWLGR